MYGVPSKRTCQTAKEGCQNAAGAAVAGAAAVYFSDKGTKEVAADAATAVNEQIQQLVNWSGTHQVQPSGLCRTCFQQLC